MRRNCHPQPQFDSTPLQLHLRRRPLALFCRRQTIGEQIESLDPFLELELKFDLIQQVGPRIVANLGDAMSCLRVCCNTSLVGNQLSTGLRDTFFQLYLGLASLPNGPIVKGVGPLDAEMCYVEALLKLSVQGLDIGLIIRVIQAIGKFRENSFFLIQI